MSGSVVRLLRYSAQAVMLFVLLEWLFFLTKPSFLSTYSLVEQLAVPLITATFVVPLVCLATFVLSGAAIFGHRGMFLPALVPATLSASLLLLLVDNYTYAFLRFGIVTAGPVLKLLYALAYLSAAFLWTRFFYQRAAEEQNHVHWGVAVSMALCIGVGGVLALARVPTRDLQFSSPDSPRGTLPNILLIGIDGLESRFLSAYGYRLATTPALERVAERSILFENAFSNVGKSTGSLISMLTGRAAADSKVGFPPQILRGRHSFEHLPGMLRQLGYRGVQESVRYYADSGDNNLRMSFDVANGRSIRVPSSSFVKERLYEFDAEAVFLGRVAERVGRRLAYLFGLRPMVNHYLLVSENQGLGPLPDESALSAVYDFAQAEAGPWFAQVHLMSTHCCVYRVPQGWFSPSDFDVPRPLADTLSLYANAIRGADELLGGFWERMEESGLLDNTIVVFYSDHTRTWGTRERVPLLIRFPTGPEGRRVSENVELLDVAPTIMGYLGLEQPSWMPGRDLGQLDVLSQPTNADHPIFSFETFEYERYGIGGGVLSIMGDPGPPTYGVESAGLVLCDQAFSIRLADGSVDRSVVEGHTAPCPGLDSSVMKVRQLVRTHLSAFGFELPAWR